MTHTTSAPSTTIRRLSERQLRDRDALDALLDAALVGHVAAVADGHPLVVPMAMARDGDRLLLHGSTGGGFALRGGVIAVSVTELDAVVYARSLYDSSMNYRSAVVYGVPEVVPDEQKEAALLTLSERLMPGRAAEVRPMTRKELAATRVLSLPLDDFAMKVRAGAPSEAADDGEDRTVWAGLLPLAAAWGAPVASPLTVAGVPVPPSVRSRAASAPVD